MDKGWAWVTMLAAFGTHIACGGLQNSAGFMRIVLLQNADENEKRYITWITSTYSGMTNLAGPIASFIVYRYGCRTTVLIGASMEVIGFIVCFLVRDIWIYIISYSLLAGFGSGLTHTAIIALISFNFDRYLSFASGVAMSGQGVGLTIMPIVCSFIFDKFGLQPTFLLIGGITLQKLVLGALMRPSSLELDQISKLEFKELNAINENKSVNEQSFKTENGNNDAEKVFSSGISPDIEVLKQESDHKENSKQISAIFTTEIEAKAETSAKSVYVISGQDNKSYNFYEVENTTEESHSVRNTPSITSKKENDSLCLTVDEMMKNDYLNISEEDLRPKNKMDDMPVKFSCDEEVKTNSSVKMAASGGEFVNTTRTSISFHRKENPYSKVLKIRKFIFLLLAILLFSVPEEIVYMMYPNYALTNGSSQSEVSNLLSIIGIFSVITRLLMGATANSKIVSIYILFTMPFVLLGVATLLLPYYVHTFTGRVFYAIFFGLYNCGVYSLLNELVEKITGTDNMPAAFGFILLLKGTIGIFASPLADAIQTYAEDPDASFVFAGSLYTTSLLMIVFLP